MIKEFLRIQWISVFTYLKKYFSTTSSFGKCSPGKIDCVYIFFVCLLLCKSIWGIWEHDLTAGDTSSYFRNAVLWHSEGKVNILWSPLYTAYYGSWLAITDNAVYVTLLHRIGLIVSSTVLVAWFGYLTLPRIFALLLVAWWIGLPIHYDTLYEVHLFGCLPILLMAVVACKANDDWRTPLLLGIALISTALIRNEYAAAVTVFAAWEAIGLLMTKPSEFKSFLKRKIVHYATIFAVAGTLVGYFYSVSYIQGQAVEKNSAQKHAFNMCQGYAFGYLQHKTDWSGDPWTECSALMRKQFGIPNPSLRDMLIANSPATAQHFLWNLSLIRAGIEVLLFNATSSEKNPDFVPVTTSPFFPTLLLALTIAACAGGAFKLRHHPEQYPEVRNQFASMLSLLAAAFIMGLAVSLIQRPRPSYLLGQGVLYMWLVFRLLSVLVDLGTYRNLKAQFPVFVILMLALPSYHTLALPSKVGKFGDLYMKLHPVSAQLCTGSGGLFIGQHYRNDIYHYLCSFSTRSREIRQVTPRDSFSGEDVSTPEKFVQALNFDGITALVVDNILITQNPGLNDCPTLRNVFLSSGWQQLLYVQESNPPECTAAYFRQ